MQPAPLENRGTGALAASPLPSASELTAQPAVRIAGAVRAGELSAEEVAAAHLRHIAEVDPVVHALVEIDGDRALAKARRIDERRRRGEVLGPLAGVPFVVKDNIDVRRRTTACGSAAHEVVLALRHAPAVARLLSAGAVLLGRANMDEFAMGASTRTSAFGPTRNPCDPRRSPGGSSGGSAAAVAAGFAPLSLGTDTGGSIREPAAQCGVAGMAPSAGLVSVTGVVPFAPDFDRVGPLARNCPDAALMLAVLTGRRGLAVEPGSAPLQLRIGVVEQLCGPGNQPGVLARLAAAQELLGRRGAELVPVSVPDAVRGLDAYMTITSAACVPVLASYVRTGQAGAEVTRRWEFGRALLDGGARHLASAYAVQHRLVEQTRQALATCDLLLSPTMPTTAPLLADAELAGPELAAELPAPYTECWTVVANLARLPALSVPAGRSSDDGMPVGVMLAGRPGSDALLLQVGAALEAAGLPTR
ncbi:MAG TPA: amidase [Jatrophihabitans sp.]|nr:amidase [Jatrophihabitans sp.]